MPRILIIGSPGAGKSTFARQLAARTGLPLLHLDDLYWQPGWVRVERVLWLERLHDALQGEHWIMEGNYNSTLPKRLERADTVILFALPREVCLWRVVKRELSGVHPHMTGLRRRLPEWWFLLYTWAFPRKVPGILEVLARKQPLRLMIIRNALDLRRILDFFAVDFARQG